MFLVLRIVVSYFHDLLHDYGNFLISFNFLTYSSNANKMNYRTQVYLWVQRKKDWKSRSLCLTPLALAATIHPSYLPPTNERHFNWNGSRSAFMCTRYLIFFPPSLFSSHSLKERIYAFFSPQMGRFELMNSCQKYTSKPVEVWECRFE